jgi:epoxyqueuosine reductase
VLSVEDANTVLQKHASYLQDWQRKGHSAEMGYMQRSSEMFSTLATVLEQAHSVVCFAAPYSGQGFDGSDKLPEGCGRVARYAWGRDYHRVLVKKLRNLVDTVCNEELDGLSINSRVFTDAVPLLERSLSQAAGLGFVGKNSMLITPKRGSFQFLAEIVWDIDVAGVQREVKTSRTLTCGSCNKCLQNCPTEALVSERVLDANRCISYLTIEHKGPFDDWQRKAVGTWLFGCDECQEICPFNKPAANTPGLDEFGSGRGPGPYLNIAEILAIRTHGEFIDRFAGTALMRTGREGLIRNACAVAVNSGIFNCVNELRECALEQSSLVRTVAQQTLDELIELSDGLDKQRLSKVLDEVSRLTSDGE